MIFTERKITVRKGKSSIDEPVILYRGDYEVELRFTIMESKYRFKSGVNLVDSEKASHAQLALLAPDGTNVFTEVGRCEDGTAIFVLSKEMIDELSEVGLYSFQIRLFDYYRESRITIPPIEFGIEVREPIAAEDHTNAVDDAMVGYSIAKTSVLDEPVPETFNASGQYNKTDWETGDRISEGKLNKLEDAVHQINRNEINDVAALDKRVTSNFNVLDANKADKNEVNSKVWHMSNMGQDVKEAMTGGSVAVVGRNAVDTINIKQKAVTPDKIDLDGGNALASIPLIQGSVSGNINDDMDAIQSSPNRCIFNGIIPIGDPEEQSISLLNYTEYHYAVIFGDANNRRVGGGAMWHSPGDSNPRTISYIAQIENFDLSLATCFKIQLRRPNNAAFVPESIDVDNTITVDSILILSTENIKNGAITTDKYSDNSITRNKLDGDTNKILDVAEGLVYNYTDNLKVPSIKSLNSVAGNAYYSQTEKMIKYDTIIEPNPEGGGTYGTNDAIYFETNIMRFRYKTIDISTFLVTTIYVSPNDNTERIYHLTLQGADVIMRGHRTKGSAIDSRTITNGVINQPTIGDLMTFYTSSTEIKLDGESSSGETYNVFTITKNDDLSLWFHTPVVGFLVTNAGTADVSRVYDIRFPSLGEYDIAKETDLQRLNSKATKMESDIDRIKLDLYSNEIRIPAEQWVDSGGSGVCENDSIRMVGVGKVQGSYDWMTTTYNDIIGLKFMAPDEDGWYVLETNSDNTLALAVSANFNNKSGGDKGGWVRVFTDTGRGEMMEATFINTSANSEPGAYLHIERTGPHKYLMRTKNPGEITYTDWFEVDLNIIDGQSPTSSNLTEEVVINLQDFHTSIGTILFSGYANRTIMTDIIGIASKSMDFEETIREVLNDMNIQPGSGGGVPSNVVDLVMFMGQSNMAGRGVAAQSPVVPTGHGYEFRAISDPTRLYPIVEPFGKNENNSSSGVTETSKTGSMVSSFVLNYYKVTKVPIVAVSCSKGGTQISWWQPGGGPLNDAIDRHNLAKSWLQSNGYEIRHDFMVWCQGCSDGDGKTSVDDYTQRTKNMIEAMMACGVEKCFLVRIGNHRDDPTMYDSIIQAQTELCKTYENAVLVSCKLAEMAELGLMKDQFHYVQEGYNIVGKDAGINTGFYINNLKEPTMWDPENNNLYFSHK